MSAAILVVASLLPAAWGAAANAKPADAPAADVSLLLDLATLDSRILTDGVQRKDEAFATAKRYMRFMLEAVDPSVVRSLVSRKVHIVVLPTGAKLTEVASLRSFSGKRLYSTRFEELDGLAYVPMDGGQGVAAVVPEESVVGEDAADRLGLRKGFRLDGPRGYRKGFVFVHEFAHVVKLAGLPAQAARGASVPSADEVEKIYADSMKRPQKTGLWKYADLNREEMFAEAANAYFGVGLSGETPDTLREANRPLYDLLRRVFGPPRELKP